MQIKDIVFQGIFRCAEPVRIEFADGITTLELPPTMNPSDAQTLLISLFYPRWMTPEMNNRMFTSHDVKLAATFTHNGSSYRLIRRDTLDSLRLQAQSGTKFRDVGTGAQVEQLLAMRLNMTPYAIFSVLNLWRYKENIPGEEPPFRLDGLEPRIREMVQNYRMALESEQLEDVAKSARGRMDTLRRTLGEGIKLEEKLELAREKHAEISIDGLTQEDLDLLHTRDVRVGELQRQIERLEKDIGEAEEEAKKVAAKPPWNNPVFLGAFAVSVIAIIVSVIMSDTLRPIVLVDVLGFGVCTVIGLQFFAAKEAASVHLTRRDSVKRRMVQLREEEVSLNDRFNQLLVHARVDSVNMLTERFEKSEKLGEMIVKMEERLAEITNDPAWHRQRVELREATEEYEQTEARRKDLPDTLIGSFQMEADLKQLGVDPERARAGDEGDASDGFHDDAIARLFEVARRLGQDDGNGLNRTVRKMWGKICRHVLGERFQTLDVQSGQLVIDGWTEDQVDVWERTRPQDLLLVENALATALVVNMPERAGSFETLMLPDPSAYATPEQRQRLLEVFESAAQRSQIVIARAVD